MNPVALITGASRGIGRGIALELARLGWDLVINYVRDQSAGEETVRQANVEAASFGQTIRAVAVQADISHAQDRRPQIVRDYQTWEAALAHPGAQAIHAIRARTLMKPTLAIDDRPNPLAPTPAARLDNTTTTNACPSAV